MCLPDIMSATRCDDEGFDATLDELQLSGDKQYYECYLPIIQFLTDEEFGVMRR